MQLSHPKIFKVNIRTDEYNVIPVLFGNKGEKQAFHLFIHSKILIKETEEALARRSHAHGVPLSVVALTTANRKVTSLQSQKS